jgi:hypothetical protein
MAVKELSLRMKILLACFTLFVAFIVLSLTVRVIKERLHFMQFYGYEITEISNADKELKTVEEAFKFLKEREGNVTLTLQDLKYNSNCGGYEYGIYVNEKNIKYVICQNGEYKIYKPRPFGLESIAYTINNVLNSIESAAREFITGRR